MSDERLLWVDLETEGLSPHPPENQRILEIGMKITNLNLDVIAQQAYPIYYSDMALEGYVKSLDPFIQNMHTQNGLFKDCSDKGIDLRDAEAELLDWLEFYEVPLDRTAPVHGNSLRLDREFMKVHMPVLDNRLSYRIVDVSSFKEACRRFAPELFAAYQELYPDDDKGHRVLADIDHSIDEFRFYLQGMGWL